MGSRRSAIRASRSSWPAVPSPAGLTADALNFEFNILATFFRTSLAIADARALVTQADDGEYAMLPMFFLPEETAADRINLVPYERWAQEGHIQLCPGDVIDYDLVSEAVEKIAQTFNVNEILYDPWQAEPLRQRFSKFGLPCTKFNQTAANYASPTEDFERLINEGKLYHNNPVLTWQAGHVEVKSDPNKNKRPVKRAAGDHRTIDGIVAGVMGLFGAMNGFVMPGQFYEDNMIEVA